MRSESLRLFCAALFLFSAPLFPPRSSALAQPVSGLPIRITEVPPSGGGTVRLVPLKARVFDPEGVCGQQFVNCRVALFSFAGGQWFPLPYLNSQLVEIRTNGLVEEEVHLGTRYAALVVSAIRYAPQPEKLLALPTHFALARDEARAGALRPDEEPTPAAPQPSTVPAASSASPISELTPFSAINTGSLSQHAPSSLSQFGWVGNLFRRPLWLTVLMVLLVSLLLGVSGLLKAFSEALEFSLQELIHIPARRLSRLQAVIKIYVAKIEAAKFLGAMCCFVVAVGVALANYQVAKFTFELLLPAGEALTFLAAGFVALKGVAGMLLHFFEGRLARSVVALALIFATVLGVTLTYERALAMREMNNALTPFVADVSEAGVKVNEAVLSQMRPAEDPASHTSTPAARPEASVVARLFSQEAILVAAIAFVMDVFEVLCVFGALHLSAKGVVWAVCLPIQLPLGIAKEGLWLIHRTKLMAVMSVLIRAALEAPKVITVGVVVAARELYRAAVEGAKKITAALISLGRALVVWWRKRKITALRRAGVLERVRIREANKTAEAQSVKDRADDRRASIRKSQQRKNQFNEEALNAT